MRIVYSVGVSGGPEYPTIEEAKAHVEALGEGSVVTWVVSPNMPRCLPAEVYRSSALTSYANGVWTEHNIHGW